MLWRNTLRNNDQGDLVMMVCSLKKSMRPLTALLCTSALACAAPAAASDEDWGTASDVVRTALVAAAIGVPVVEGDDRGALEAAMSIGAAFLATEALKSTIPSQRPNGRDNRSFPSGHTSASFAAAATLSERQGWEIGVPAHIAAAFVAVARVQAHEHRWRDVAAGAVIGEVAGRLLTHRPSDRVAIIPWGDTTGGGVTVAARF
jgi:membrane-associated phospholipid phosphatase